MKLSDASQLFIKSHTGLKKEENKLYKWTLGLLGNFIGDPDIEIITIHMLREWRGVLMQQKTLWETHPTRPTVERPISPATVHGHIRRVRRFFTWLVQEDVLSKSPATRLELPPLREALPKHISNVDVKTLISIARESDPRDYAIVRLLAETGCRVGGLVKIKLPDMELELINNRARILTVEKGNRKKFLYFGEETLQAIESWLKKRPTNKGNNLFVGRKGNLTTSGVYQLLRRLATKAPDIKRINPHALRHGTARRMIDAGASMDEVAAVLGHSTPDVTRRFYSGWNDEDTRNAHNKYAGL